MPKPESKDAAQEAYRDAAAPARAVHEAAMGTAWEAYKAARAADREAYEAANRAQA